MNHLEKVHQFLTAYETLQLESFSDSQFDEHVLEENHVHWLESCDSTSDFVKSKLSGGLKEPIICISDTQTKGKGQRDSFWFSPVGNLHMSLYLPLQSHVSSTDIHTLDGRLSLETALALLGMPILQSAKLNPEFKVGVKWPNDLCTLPRNSRQKKQLTKFSGILIEPVSVKPKQQPNTEVTLASLPRLCGVVIGIGINANHTQTSEIDFKPITNLQNMVGHTISLADLAAQVCQACQKAIATFITHGDSLPVRFFGHDLVYDATIQVEQFNKKTRGVATGIQATGALTVMESLESNHVFYDGKVTLVD